MSENLDSDPRIDALLKQMQEVLGTQDVIVVAHKNTDAENCSVEVRSLGITRSLAMHMLRGALESTLPKPMAQLVQLVRALGGEIEIAQAVDDNGKPTRPPGSGTLPH